MALVALVSLTPVSGRAGGLLWDKAIHCTVYVLFMLLGLPLCRRAHHLWLLFVLALAYGALIEWGQSFVPGRDTSAADMLANALGASLGLGLAWWQSGRQGVSDTALPMD